jgi:hypothetical protein
MFGYIQPETPHLFIKDETLYKALYCGLCKGIKKGCGNCARTALTYDMAFMSALLHNIAGVDVKIEKQRCFLHPLKRRPMTVVDDMTVLLGAVNTLLAYYKLKDDKQDGDKKGAFAFLYKGGYKRALKAHPQAEQIIREQTEEQAKLEKEGCSSIDMACEPTAVMMQKLSDYVLGDKATEHTAGLCYAIGKWVYLADALDDFDKDVKKGRYNVFFNAFGGKDKKECFKTGEKDILFIFNSLFATMREHLAKIKFNFNHDLTDNIILLGIPAKSRQLFFGECGTGKRKMENEQK